MASIEEIQTAVAEHCGISRAMMLSESRKRRIVRPRQISMMMVRDVLGLPWVAIGEAYGKDHTTVTHARKAVSRMFVTSEAARCDYEELRQRIERTTTARFYRHGAFEFKTRRAAA